MKILSYAMVALMMGVRLAVGLTLIVVVALVTWRQK